MSPEEIKKQRKEESIKSMRKMLGEGKEADRLIQQAIEREEMHEEFLEVLEKELGRAVENYSKVCRNSNIPSILALLGLAKLITVYAANISEAALDSMTKQLVETQKELVKFGGGKFI